MSMTTEALRLCIKRKDWCDNPTLIDKLYLHHRGFKEIRNLEPFFNVKTLFLESNELKKIHNLTGQRRLQCLHLQSNKLEKIENLEKCELKYLNVSHNEITKIDDLSKMFHLETLVMTRNKLSKPESIANLTSIPKLRELDMSSNHIDCAHFEAVVKILSQCKNLKILALKGNPIAKQIPHYRKIIVSRCTRLTCLDGRRVCGEERRRCNAWGKVVFNGGSFEEANEADQQALLGIRAEQSSTNALKRSRREQSQDDGRKSFGAGETRIMNAIQANVSETMKKAFGLVESKMPSSSISWSSRRSSTRSDGLIGRKKSQESGEFFEDTDGSIRKVKRSKSDGGIQEPSCDSNLNFGADDKLEPASDHDGFPIKESLRSSTSTKVSSRSSTSTAGSSFEFLSIGDTFGSCSLSTDEDLLGLNCTANHRSEGMCPSPTYSLFPPPPPPRKNSG